MAIYLDVSSLVNWSNSPVGISRIEYEVACSWLNSECNILFCYFDADTSAYNILSDVRLKELIGNFGSGQLKMTNDRKVSRVWRMMKRFVPEGIKVVIKRLQSLKGRIKSKSKVEFVQGDFFVFLSIPRNYNELNALSNIARTNLVEIYCYFHDAIPLIFPNLTSSWFASFFADYFNFVSRNCSGVIFNSQCSLVDFERLQGPVSLRSKIISPAVGDFDFDTNMPISDAIKMLLADSFILYVSTIEPRKNHDILYRAYLLAYEQGISLPKLVLLGQHGWMMDDQIHIMKNDQRVSDRIVFIHGAGDHELALLYKYSLFCVYASFYEGWGMPVSEALSFGKFCLTSGRGALVEAASGFCEEVNPHDAPAWCERIHYYASHTDKLLEREKLIQSLYRPTHWNDFANSVYDFVASSKAIK